MQRLLKVAHHPVRPLKETILIVTMHDHDTVPLSHNILALASCDILEYRIMLNLVVTIGLHLCSESAQCVFEGFLGGGIGHSRL